MDTMTKRAARLWAAEKRAQAEILRTIAPGPQRIISFALFIEQMPHAYPVDGQDYPSYGFSMHTWGACDWGTPACIGGWIDRVWPSEYYVTAPMVLSRLTGTVGRDSDHYALFCCAGFSLLYSSITPRRAAQVLRHFAETGEVDWNIT